jgi:hypothetical protein
MDTPHFREGLQRWHSDFQEMKKDKAGIEWLGGCILYLLTIFLLSQWIHIGWGNKPKAASLPIEMYVLASCVWTGWFYVESGLCSAIVSTYFSASTVIVLLNSVLLRRVWGSPFSPERSLFLFMFNVAQIVVMFATWYKLGNEENPLLISVLTFATIAHSDKMPNTTIAQIGTDFVLLAIFLTHLLSEVGSREDTKHHSRTPADPNG